MAKKTPYPIVGGFDNLQTQGEDESTYNMYIVVPAEAQGGTESLLMRGSSMEFSVTSAPTQGQDPAYLINYPGDTQLFTFSKGVRSRGRAYQYEGNLYCVVSQYLFKVSKQNNAVAVGTLNTDIGWVEIQGNNAGQLMVVDGATGYIYDINTTIFQQITDPGFFTNPTTLAYLDGSFIVNSAGTNNWQLSDENNGLSWSQQRTAQFETQWDHIVAIRVNVGQVYLIGNLVTETWIDTGQPAFPYQRNSTGTYQIGTKAVGSCVQAEGTMFFLGNTLVGTTSVYMSMGAAPTKISTMAVDREMNAYLHPEDAKAYMFRENGHSFYQINFTSDNASWVYNITNNTWTKLKMSDGTRYVMEDVTNFNGVNYARAYNDANMYQLGQHLTNYHGLPILKERVGPLIVSPTYSYIRMSYCEAFVSQGFSPETGNSDQPYIWMSISKDRGASFNSAIRKSMGKKGETGRRTYWHNPTGVSHNYVIRLQNWDDIQFYIFSFVLILEQVGS